MKQIVNESTYKNQDFIVDSNSLPEKLGRYRTARDRAIKWLLSLQHADGSIGPVEEGAYYYRLIWTLTAVGETEAVCRFLRWLQTRMLTEEGELQGEFPLGNYISRYTYLMANLVYGAQLMGRFDIAQSGIRILRRFHDAVSGGFSNANPDLKPNNWIETWISAQAGFAFLIVGCLDVAEEVGNFLQRVYDLQPAISKKLLFVYDRVSKSLITNSGGEEASYSVNVDKTRQCFYVPGIISAFLVQLYRATDKVKFLELAKKYQDFVQGCTLKQFDGIEVCKTGWGAALLFQATGEHKYRDWAVRVGDYFVNTQQDDGRWVDDRFPSSTDGLDIALTAQHILWIDAILSALACGM